MDKNLEICDWCGEGVYWVNSLGYCKECMEWHIEQYHKENKEKEISFKKSKMCYNKIKAWRLS